MTAGGIAQVGGVRVVMGSSRRDANSGLRVVVVLIYGCVLVAALGLSVYPQAPREWWQRGQAWVDQRGRAGGLWSAVPTTTADVARCRPLVAQWHTSMLALLAVYGEAEQAIAQGAYAQAAAKLADVQLLNAEVEVPQCAPELGQWQKEFVAVVQQQRAAVQAAYAGDVAASTQRIPTQTRVLTTVRQRYAELIRAWQIQ